MRVILAPRKARLSRNDVHAKPVRELSLRAMAACNSQESGDHFGFGGVEVPAVEIQENDHGQEGDP